MLFQGLKVDFRILRQLSKIHTNPEMYIENVNIQLNDMIVT